MTTDPSAASALASTGHEGLVSAQFSPRAEAYVTSLVHAQGADLQALAAALTGHAGARVLDLGCGGGHVSFTASPHVARVVAYDLSERMLEAVRREAGVRGLGNIETLQGVAEKLPFPDASFDFVVSRFSAHHWGNMAAGVAEAHRVLKPGGRAIFMDVVAPKAALLDSFLQTIEMLRDPSHVRNYSVAQWIETARAAGFALVGTPVERRLRLEFASWIARINTPEIHAAAIRSLQVGASKDVLAHFAVEPDGTFTLDTADMTFAPV